MFSDQLPTPIERIQIPEADSAGCELWVKRDDLIHPEVSGNKWRKLDFNLEQAKAGGFKRILTFGGAYSNHIAACGAIAGMSGFEIHAMIRGEELNKDANYTLQTAAAKGLQLHFVNRQDYRQMKKSRNGTELEPQWHDAYVIPEGGANEAGVKGCEAIYPELDQTFDHIALSAGTGTTAAGILRSMKDENLLVFPALKGGEFLKEEILHHQTDPISKGRKLSLHSDYHFGGFGKITEELSSFVGQMNSDHQLPLDYLYTAKALFGIVELLKKGHFKAGSRILFYHSGGLQGNRGFH